MVTMGDEAQAKRCLYGRRMDVEYADEYDGSEVMIYMMVYHGFFCTN